MTLKRRLQIMPLRPDSQTTMPTVSIGMPVYNCEVFIREAIETLLAQTFDDFELIISDNASTDATEAICCAYAARDARIRYIRQAKNLGAVANFEYVLAEAVGEYFMWAAGDDACEPTFIERLLAVLKSDDSFALAMCDVKNISETGALIDVSVLDNIRADDVRKDWNAIRPRFFENPTTHVFFAIYGLFRQSILRKISLNYFGRVKYASGSEIPLLAQIATRGKIASIPDQLKLYRRHGNSVYTAEQKQKMSNAWMRLLNLLNISNCLVSIAIRSELLIREKIQLLTTILRTGSYRIFSFIFRVSTQPKS